MVNETLESFLLEVESNFADSYVKYVALDKDFRFLELIHKAYVEPTSYNYSYSKLVDDSLDYYNCLRKGRISNVEARIEVLREATHYTAEMYFNDYYS